MVFSIIVPAQQMSKAAAYLLRLELADTDAPGHSLPDAVTVASHPYLFHRVPLPAWLPSVVERRETPRLFQDRLRLHLLQPSSSLLAVHEVSPVVSARYTAPLSL